MMTILQNPRLRGFVCNRCCHELAHGRKSISSATRPPEIYDIVTVGGGPVGLALVAALKSSSVTKHLRVALIESHSRHKLLHSTPKRDEYSNRASSLTPSSVSFLEAIGAWQHVDQSRVQPYHEMQVWDGSNGAKIQFDWAFEAMKYNSPLRTVATMTENANLSKALLSRVLEVEETAGRMDNEDQGSLMFDATVSSIKNGVDDPQGLNLSSWPVLCVSSVEQETPTLIAARLLVGADGANSPVRTFAGIASEGWDYNRHAVVATLNTDLMNDTDIDSLFVSEPPKSTAYQRFLPILGGPIALLPLPDGKASLVWSTRPAHAAYLKSLPADTFTTMVNAAFRLSMTDLSYMLSLPPNAEFVEKPNKRAYTHADELSWRLQHTPLPSHIPPIITSVQPGTIASFPLRFRQASTYISPRVALIGDAAHTIHPLAGQGLNLGLGDARGLFRTIESAVLHGQDLGDQMMVLSRYNAERWRKGAMVGGTCDALHKMYAANGEVVGWGRGIGLGLVDRLPWVKNWVMTQAEGS